MSKERPILFSTPMVQALRAGTKTMTRRIVKFPLKSPTHHISINDSDTPPIAEWCPYGKVGDRLWVRESCRIVGGHTEKPDFSVMSPSDFVYKADEEWNGPWTPSIHMPRTACRIILEITAVRAERIQDITDNDAKAEGVGDSLNFSDMEALKGLDWVIKRPFLQRQFAFLALWCKINGAKSWEANPWVWVVEFKVLSKKGKRAQK